jgi:predicted nuclease of predicted toxin-antitoxin system
MRFLANENVPRDTIHVLRAAGWEVAAIAEERPSISDVEVLAKARAENRIVITFDRDYGELLYARGHAPPPGVIYLRAIPASPSEAAEWLLAMSRQELCFEGFFTIFSSWNHVRQRQLSPSG